MGFHHIAIGELEVNLRITLHLFHISHLNIHLRVVLIRGQMTNQGGLSEPRYHPTLLVRQQKETHQSDLGTPNTPQTHNCE